MEAPIIRIQQIEIENLKNVSWGRINMSKYGNAAFMTVKAVSSGSMARTDRERLWP